MKEDALIHSKALKEGSYEQGVGVKIMIQKPIETANQSQWEIMDHGFAVGEHACNRNKFPECGHQLCVLNCFGDPW